MSAASARLAMKHLCTIERDVSTAAWGHASTPDWQPHLTDLPCRIWTRAGREAVDATTEVVVEDMRMIVPLGTDVTANDRIDDVTERGETIVDGPVGVRAVLRNQDHLELVLVRLS